MDMKTNKDKIIEALCLINDTGLTNDNNEALKELATFTTDTHCFIDTMVKLINCKNKKEERCLKFNKDCNDCIKSFFLENYDSQDVYIILLQQIKMEHPVALYLSVNYANNESLNIVPSLLRASYFTNKERAEFHLAAAKQNIKLDGEWSIRKMTYDEFIEKRQYF